MMRLLIWPVLLLLLSACSAFTAKDNADPPAELVEFTPSIEIETLWDTSVAGMGGQYLAIRPALRDDRLFIADPDGQVLALDAGSGEILWEHETEAPLSGGPGIIDDLVVLGTSEAELIALDVEKGEERWRRRVSSEVLSVPAGESGVVVVRSIDGRVLGINADTGESRWVFDRASPVLILRGDSSPLVENGRAFIGFANGKMACLALDSGNPLWETPITTPHGRTELERVVDIHADPLLVEGVIYGATFQGELAAISETSGVVLWNRELSTHTGLDADWRQVYVTDEEDHVWALDATNGATLWQQQEMHARRLSAPAIIGEYLVVGDYAGYLHWLAQDDGRVLARIRVGDEGIRAKPLVVHDVVYVFDDGGNLTALKPMPLDAEKPDKPGIFSIFE